MSLGRFGLYYGYIAACFFCLIDARSSFANEASRKSCDRTRDTCSRRVGCGMALHNFYIACDTVMKGKGGGCTKPCKQALISLLSTEDKLGAAFINCDCEGDKHCLASKNHVEVCAQDVLKAMESINDDTTPLSCSLAQWICEADTSCLAAWNFYRQYCSEFFDGSPDYCNHRCNNSLDILYGRTKAKKLRTCECDDPATKQICQAVKDNTERLCFNKSPLQRPSSDQPGKPLNSRGHGYSYEQKSPNAWSNSMVLTTSEITLLISFVIFFVLSRTHLH